MAILSRNRSKYALAIELLRLQLSTSKFLELFQLLAIPLEISKSLRHGIAAEFFQGNARQGEGDHGFAGNACGRDNAHIRALIGRFDGFASLKVHRLQRTPQGGDRLQVAANDAVLSVGDAAFDSARVV